MQFRQKALSKLQSPEELDVPVRFARPQGRIVLLVTVVVMVAAAVWSVTGTVSSKLDAPGVLTHGQGTYLLQSPVAGQVTEVLAKEGELLGADEPLVRVRTEAGVTAIRTVAPGRVTTVAAGIGSVVTAGADVALLERVRGPDDPLVATLYVPGAESEGVSEGDPVDLTVQSVSTQQYGVLRGTVESVGRSPRGAEQIASFVGDARLAEQFTRDGPPVAVRVRLEKSPGTESGLRWSVDGGPPFGLESSTTVSGAVRLDSQHPAEWLLP
ncbi:HlyD family efflux transporter periplasmic adaptor subunit [Streptomyces sp. DSM 42041]|uniref:HlyD family efflux transporter periplasmic adaptor subunit n=1 Tax=Streptomyces hazeniae TaxID=3075538 RepID=A0ABU2NQB6_9ACTN|nr:HlyD family efflux transporter periplasmic adaptor subunit [Streptomyces sp. DSM 42041]MDT0379171.1 HlyD family efflux transporter periplasmic adaptor subunit [Streptomyces sp. DSM 42041]